MHACSQFTPLSGLSANTTTPLADRRADVTGGVKDSGDTSDLRRTCHPGFLVPRTKTLCRCSTLTTDPLPLLLLPTSEDCLADDRSSDQARKTLPLPCGPILAHQVDSLYGKARSRTSARHGYDERSWSVNPPPIIHSFGTRSVGTRIGVEVLVVPCAHARKPATEFALGVSRNPLSNIHISCAGNQYQ
jgi:hypothetical protein